MEVIVIVNKRFSRTALHVFCSGEEHWGAQKHGENTVPVQYPALRWGDKLHTPSGGLTPQSELNPTHTMLFFCTYLPTVKFNL